MIKKRVEVSDQLLVIFQFCVSFICLLELFNLLLVARKLFFHLLVHSFQGFNTLIRALLCRLCDLLLEFEGVNFSLLLLDECHDVALQDWMQNFQRAQVVLLISDQALDHLKFKLVLSIVLSIFGSRLACFWRGVCIRDTASILLIVC
jgi:hypothetical protein